MRRRLLIVMGLVGLAALGAVLVVWLTGPNDRISRETYDVITAGMMELDVETLLGVPAGDYRDNEDLCYRIGQGPGFAAETYEHGEITKNWFGRGGWVMVGFDEELHFLKKPKVWFRGLLKAVGAKWLPCHDGFAYRKLS